MYKQIVVSVFLYSPFSNIGGVFRYDRQSGGEVRKKPYLCNEWTNSYTFDITTLSINLSNFWVCLALDKIVYCENKYAMDFFPKSLQETKQKL